MSSRNKSLLPLPTYIINLSNRHDRRKSMEDEFHNRPEFDIHFVDAVRNVNGAIGIWQSLVKTVAKAEQQGLEKILFCEDDHCFTNDYSEYYLHSSIKEAERLGVEILSGGICGYGEAVRAASNLYWIDWYWGNQFLIIYRNMYQRILDYRFCNHDTADGVLSCMATRKMVMYPFISQQKEFGYSDITSSNGNKGFMSGLFTKTNMRLKYTHSMNVNLNGKYHQNNTDKSIKRNNLFPVVYQKSIHDCGLACLKMVSDLYGIEYNPYMTNKIAEIMKNGISIYDMRATLSQMGIESIAMRCSIEDYISTIASPSIALLNNNHYIIILGYDGHRILIVDPSTGYQLLDISMLRNIWYQNKEQRGILICW